MTTILNGVLGGVLAGAVAAVVTRAVVDDPPATAAVLERTVGPRASSFRWAGFAAQVLYGSLAGGTLVALELFALGILAVPPTAGEAFGVAFAWSALLFGVLSVARRIVSSNSFGRSHLGELFVYHLAYGIGLGLWIRMTWST